MIRKLRGIVQSNIEPKDHEVMWQYKGRLYYYNNGDWELLDTPTPSDIEYESPEDGKTYTLQEILDKLVQEQKDPIVVPQEDNMVTLSWDDGLYSGYGAQIINGELYSSNIDPQYSLGSSYRIPEIKTSKPLESTDKIVLYRYLVKTKSRYCKNAKGKQKSYKTRSAKWTICPKSTWFKIKKFNGGEFDTTPFSLEIGDYLLKKSIKLAYKEADNESLARKILDYFYDNFCEVYCDDGTSLWTFRVYSGSRVIETFQPSTNIVGYTFTYNRIGLAVVDENFNLKSNLLRFKIVLDKRGKEGAKLLPVMTQNINQKL